MSELTKTMLAFDELVIASRVPDRQLDPPERPDMTDAEYCDRRVRIVRSMPLSVIDDALADVSGQLSVMLAVEFTLQEKDGRTGPHDTGKKYLAERLNDLLRPHIDAYIEHEIGQGKP